MNNSTRMRAAAAGRERFGDITLKKSQSSTEPCPPVCGPYSSHFEVDDYYQGGHGDPALNSGQRMQSAKVQVVVQDDQSVPIPFANVAELDSAGNIIGQGAATNSQGIAEVNPGWVQVSHVGYKTATFETEGDATGVTLEDETYNLPTVTIRPHDPTEQKILMAGIVLAVIGLVVFISQKKLT